MDKIREVRPARMPMVLAIDETRKSHAQGFERRGRCERTSIFNVLPTIPKTKIKIPK